MKGKVIAAASGAALLAGTYAWQQGDIVVRSDPGGEIQGLYQQYYEQWLDGDRHVIDGRCASACTMRTAFEFPSELAVRLRKDNSTCITPNGRLGFHKAYYLNFFGLKIGSPWGTRYMMERWPDRIRARIEPVLSHDMTWLNAQEAVELGVPAC